MAKTKVQKQTAVKALSEKLAGAKFSIIFKHEGLQAAATHEVREKCRAQNVEVLATKKTLLRLALEDQGIKDANVKAFEGGLAIAISKDDEVAGAKVLKELSKKYEALQFRGGILEGKLLSLEEVTQLANIPSKMELLSKLVGSLKSPISGFVNVLQGNLRGLVCVLNAIKNNK